MYELNGDEYSLEQLQGAAEKYGMDFDSYLETMKQKGLVEKTQDVAATDAAVTSQPDTDLASEDTSWGSQLYNNFQGYINPFVPQEEKVLYKAGVDPEKVRTESATYKNQIENFNKELDKAFGPNGELFGKVIENPNNLSLEDRKQKAGEFGTPEEYLLDLIKQQVGGMGWSNEKTELGEAKYGLLNQDDIESVVKDKFNVELEQYLENKANNFAINKAQEIGDGKIRDWQEENRSTLANAYQGINKEIAGLVEKLNYGNLEGEKRTAVYQELLQKKQEKGEGTSMLFDLNTRKLVIARDKKDAEQRIDENENLIDLGIQEEQTRINEKLGLLDADDQLDYLRNEFETSALTYAGHQKYLNQNVRVEVSVPGASEEGFQGDETEFRSVPLRQILQEELGTNWVTKSLKGLKLEDRVDVKALEGLTTPEGKVLKNRDDIEDFIQILANNELDYTREYNATKNMYLLNEGLVDLEKPEYVPSTIIPKNMAALKQAGKSLMRPWSGEYYADKIIGSTGRDEIIATGEVYDNLGIKKTEKEQEQLEVNLREMVNDGLLQSNKMLVEFAGINKGLAAVGATARFARLMQALEKGKYVKDGTRYSKAAIKARARARNMEASDYAKMVGIKEVASVGNRGLQIMANGLMEGLKFEAFTQFDITNMQLKPEAGEQFGFATGFGFGAAGRVLAPLSPLLQRRGYLKDIDGNLLKYAPTTRQARIGLNSRKLFETFVTAPASFVAGSEGGELVNMLVEDAMGDASFSNYLDEHYGHHDEVGKRLISNYFIGLGFGVGHFKGFSDYKSKAALERVANKELNILRNEFGGLAKLTSAEKNNIFSKESIKKLHKNLSDENLSKFYKHYDIYEMAYSRRQAAIRAEGYMDPSRAEELVRQDHKKLVAEERAAGRTLRFEVVNNNRLKPFQKKMTDKAQIIDSPDGKGKTIRYNADFYTPDVLAHEVHHYYTEDLLGRDVVFKADFMNNLNSIASKIELGRLVTEVEAKELGNEARTGQRMNLSEAIKLEKFDITNPRKNTKISQWELFAHIAEQIGNKNNYMDVKNSNGFAELKGLLSNLAKPTGKKLNLSKEADVVRWFSEYASNVKKGKSVVDLFAELNSVVDKDAIKINQQKALFEQSPGSTRLSSRDLLKEKTELIEQNKELARTKSEGYLQLAKENAKKIKAINENIRISEANEKNIKTYQEREAGDPTRTRAENELIKDNTGIIEDFIKSEFDPNLPVKVEDFRAETYAQVTKIMNRYDAATGVPFGAYLKQSLGGKHTGQGFSQQGNILRAAQKGKTVEISFSQMGKEFDINTLVDQGSLETAGLKTVEAGGKEGKRVEDTFKWTESDVAEKIDRAVVEKDIDVEGYVYKDIKKEVAGVELVKRVDKKTGKTKMVRPTKAVDVKATGGLVDVLEVVSKEFGISDVRRVLADQNLTTEMRDAARNYIYKHRKASQESMPEAETVSGVATGIYNTNLKPMYVEVAKRGKVSEGRTAAGKAVIEKRTDFREADYLALFNIRPDGTFTPFAEGRSLSQVDGAIREAIKQTTVIAANQSIRKQYPGKYQVLGAGRGEAMASKMLDVFMERFPENTFEQASEKFYRAYLNDTRNITAEELQYLKNMELEPGLINREAALLFGYAEAASKAGKAKQKSFKQDVLEASVENIRTADGQIITAAEIKSIADAPPIIRTRGKDLVLDAEMAEQHVKHSVEFSKLIDPRMAENKTFYDQMMFLHQRVNMEGRISGERKGGGRIIDTNGNPVVNQPYTKGSARTLEVVGSNKDFINTHWKGTDFTFNKADSQVTGQKKLAKAKTAAEEVAIIEEFFSPISEKNKFDIYNKHVGAMEYYIHSGKTKAEVLSRMEWAARSMKANSNLRNGLRQNAPILALFKGVGKMTDAKFKLEHLKTSKKQSSTAFELIAQNKWRQYGPETLKDFVGVLAPKKLLDIIDAKGGKVNSEALYRMALLEPNTLKQFVTVESKGKENLLDYVLKNVKSDLNKKALKEALSQKKLYDTQSKQIANRIGKNYKPQGLVLNSKNLNNIDEALIEGRKRNKNPRGMSTFDFDDTLATTKSGIRYEMPNPSGKPQPGRKAILIAGNAGAGKTTVVEQLGLRKQGFKYVNQDIALDWLTKNNGLPKDMNSFTREQSQKWRDLQSEAAVAAKNKASKLRGKGDGVVIDGTGAVGVQFQGMARKFKEAGYDVQVVFIESSLETALARNKGRSERKLTDATVRNSVEAAQKNKKAFQDMVKFFPYSAKGFVEINTNKLKQGEPLPAEFVKTMDNFTKGYIKGRINAEQFAAEGAKLLEQGAKYDFSEFNKVVEGAPGPLLGKAIERAKKFGNENMFVLTARPAESAGPIREFLKSQGLDIPLENITGLGNSTGEAKAMWMLKKFSEGYNDMYFVDDAIQNVKAVKDVLRQLDIKSDVQQALASIDLNKGVNDIMEHSLDIQSQKRFSKAEGKVRGKSAQRRRLFIPDSAADFELLLEPLYGKGKKGVENKKWFQDNVVRQFERGINDYNNARQAVTTDYMNLRKKNKDVVKLLDKEVPGMNFTNDMAMRVYIWNKAGYTIPDLAASSQQALVKHVTGNPKLQSYAESLSRLTKVEGGLKQPEANWWAETIATEISDAGRTSSRKQFLSDFIERKNEIFSEENLNKMESKLGSKWRDSIEDILDRMETGRTRAENLSGPTRGLMNYLNGSVAAIMNLNTRSATLQLISTVNFINSSFNNPLQAAKALANTKRYAKDFMFIMNSDMLKQRRQGLQINVTEAEIASAASSKNPAKAIMAKILKAGYIPTKFADSFAIATGGATFYRNAIKKYMKEGMTEVEAQKKAFVDFQAIAERTQQSSRADLISKQQTTLAGRFILPFANTPMQMNRIMMKNYLDIYKGRYKGFYGENSLTQKLSNIGYYGFLQSVIFAGLQSAGFAIFANSDDDELKAKKKATMIDGVSTSFLRGMGIQGAVLDGVVKAGQEFYRQREKKGRADYSEVGEKLLNISPPVGSKFGKLDAAGNTYKFNRNVIEDKPFQFGLEDPALRATALTVEAVTNYPINRHISKTNNVQNALDYDYSAMERFLSFLGWSVWGTNPEKAKEKSLDLTGEGGGSGKSMTKSMTKQF